MPIMLEGISSGFWRNLLLQFILLAVTYFFIEASYRIYQYATLPNRIIALVRSGGAAPLSAYVFDAATGYRYAPNIARPSWRTNSYGHVSNVEYPIAKPPNEYRIAVIGDSFTANINDTLRWPDILETDLNASPEWKQKVGGEFTRVINFGVDGFGMVSMSAMLTSHVMEFEPDLVVVNFISADILRPVTYRQPPNADSSELAAYVRGRFLGHVDWLSLCPAVISQTIGRLWGMDCGLPLRADAFFAADSVNMFADRREALQYSATAVQVILRSAPTAIFLQAPLLEELEKQPNPQWIGLVEDLQRMMPKLKVISMSPAFASLPLGPLFIRNDGHYNNNGVTVYGHAVARELISERSAGLAAHQGVP
jgi:hypothetical protein